MAKRKVFSAEQFIMKPREAEVFFHRAIARSKGSMSLVPHAAHFIEIINASSAYR